MNLIKKIFARETEERGVVSKKYISKFLNEDAIIVEAGAHTGVDTVEMAQMWPKSTIYAFEPIPELFNQLKEKTQAYSNVKCFQLALGNKTGKCIIHQSSGRSDASSSVLAPKEHLSVHPDVLFENSIEVDIITLKDWMNTEKIKKVDFLWLDLQGFEYDVLNTNPEVLNGTKVIYTEVSLIENYTNQVLYPEFKEWLSNSGFKAKKEAIAWADGGNVLFVRR